MQFVRNLAQVKLVQVLKKSRLTSFCPAVDSNYDLDSFVLHGFKGEGQPHYTVLIRKSTSSFTLYDDINCSTMSWTKMNAMFNGPLGEDETTWPLSLSSS